MSGERRLRRLSTHTILEYGQDRREKKQWVHSLIRADEDGVDRVVAVYRQKPQGQPVIAPRRNCVLGRVVEDERLGLVVAELIFGRPLARGETLIIEHEVRRELPAPAPQSGWAGRRCWLPGQEQVVEVRFDPATLPRLCEQYTRVEGREVARPVPVAEDCSIHASAQGFGPGIMGLRWFW